MIFFSFFFNSDRRVTTTGGEEIESRAEKTSERSYILLYNNNSTAAVFNLLTGHFSVQQYLPYSKSQLFSADLSVSPETALLFSRAHVSIQIYRFSSVIQSIFSYTHTCVCVCVSINSCTRATIYTTSNSFFGLKSPNGLLTSSHLLCDVRREIPAVLLVQSNFKCYAKQFSNWIIIVAMHNENTGKRALSPTRVLISFNGYIITMRQSIREVYSKWYIKKAIRGIFFFKSRNNNDRF